MEHFNRKGTLHGVIMYRHFPSTAGPLTSLLDRAKTDLEPAAAIFVVLHTTNTV